MLSRLVALGGAAAAAAGLLAVYQLRGQDAPPVPAAAAPEAAAEAPASAPAVAFPAAQPDPAPRIVETTRAAMPAEVEPVPGERRRRRRRPDRDIGPIPTPEEWQPPAGPTRIALQAGHWRADEAPAELSGLRDNGTRWERVPEWQVNLDIARRAAALLEGRGYVVDVLPAVVPPGYRAHLFIAIHADGSTNPDVSGFRVAAPRRDATGRAAAAAEVLERSYATATGLAPIETVTRRMQNYYAFNFRRYEHALHPMTIGVILETGYLTSAGDRRVIVDQPERAAQGIVEAVLGFEHTRLREAAEG